MLKFFLLFLFRNYSIGVFFAIQAKLLNTKPTLPIKTDFVGKNYPTSINEHIHVHIKEIDGKDEILLMDYSE